MKNVGHSDGGGRACGRKTSGNDLVSIVDMTSVLPVVPLAPVPRSRVANLHQGATHRCETARAQF